MLTKLKTVVIIPSRWGSTRFPGKPLEIIAGKPMIQWVFERAKEAKTVSEVIVATDDERILNTVIGFGGKAVLTSPDHPSGTDRIAEAAERLDYDIVVNIQGDEPLIPSSNIDLLVKPFLDDEFIKVTTLKTRIFDIEEIYDPNVVKVTSSQSGFALYFSRSLIPFERDNWENGKWNFSTKDLISGEKTFFRHIGAYGFKKSFLMEYINMPESDLEKAEKLEQLRIIENGIPIKIVETNIGSIGVDCREDLAKVEELLSQAERVN
jgi:3-deoxy-manno-octulosonate cytidylyltransferase (CMP-KDO synthetase)